MNILFFIHRLRFTLWLVSTINASVFIGICEPVPKEFDQYYNRGLCARCIYFVITFFASYYII